MQKSSIALVGFRATGKSHIGKHLAEALGWTFLDMDDRLAECFGKTIQEWVKCFGWEAFREEESRLLASLEGTASLVVATGGGVVLRQANREILRNRFLVVWLRAEKATILRRLAGDPKTASHRPALTDLAREAEIETLLSERKTLYEAVADLTLDTDELPPEGIVSRILAYAASVADRSGT